MWFLLDLSPRARDVDCCWRPHWLVDGLPPVACTCEFVSSFPDPACAGVAPSPMASDYFRYLFHWYPWFPIIYRTSSKISEYLILLLPMTMTLDYQCLLIILLSTVTMTLDRWCLLIVCCDGFQSSQFTYRSLMRLVPSTTMLVSSRHARCCAFAWRVHLGSSVYAVNKKIIYVRK